MKESVSLEYITERFLKIPPPGVRQKVSDSNAGMAAVLRILSFEESELSAGRLSERIGVSEARTTVLLKKLERKNYIEKIRDKKDGRVILVRLTEQGMAKANSLHESAQRAVSTIIREVGREKILTFIRLSEEIDAVVKRTCPTPPEI